MGTQASQRFAFRFSSGDFALRVQADNILPELSVSQLLAYHLGETELAIDGEFELDIREAPLREIVLRIPKGFAIARLAAAGLIDYFVSEPQGQTDAELRLVYGQPISERQVIQLRLERNSALGQPTWQLPRLEVTKAKSTRGHIAVSAEAGFRLTPERTVALTDIATAFFPRKLPGIQAAFRLAEPTWEAAMRVERLPQSIQADVFHLFSIGEGIAYGSSTINYVISGSPVSAFRVQLSDEYFNVEFTGKDVRNWQKTTNGYVVQLHTPVSGAYTLLATCERPFKPQGETLTFTGGIPLDAQSEQGHTLVVSAYQFQVKPVNVSPGLLALETAEVPAEYRLFFDAPILAAYHYTARPFNLQLALSPLAQGETLSLVVDRAALMTRISKDGEVITDVRYFVKNRGNPYFRLALAEGTTLWSVIVNGATVVPVKEGSANLIPLPQRIDPNAVQIIDLKLAARSRPKRVTAAAPVVTAPVLLAEWNVQPDTGQRLVYRGGSLAPAGGVADASGFAGLVRMFRGEALVQLLTMLVLIVFALWAWRWAAREGTQRYSVRHLGGGLVGVAAVVLAGVCLLMLWERASHENQFVPGRLSFLAPVQQSGSALTVDVANVPDELSFWTGLGRAWPALLAFFAWAYAFTRPRDGFRAICVALGWTLLGWAALRWPNGANLFLLLFFAFLVVQVLHPAARVLFQVPRRPSPAGEGATVPATAAFLLGGLLFMTAGQAGAATTQSSPGSVPRDSAIAESVIQEVQVEEKFALATAKIRWHAAKNQTLPLLYEPAVLTRIIYPTNALKLLQGNVAGKRVHQLVAQQEGSFDLEVQYQLHVLGKEGESGFVLPTQHGLVNRLTLTIPDLDVDVFAPNAVSIQRDDNSTNATVVAFVLAPASDSWIGWKPRSRDVKRERAVFFAELFQLYVPAAGVIEGVHQVQVRPAQGELSELIFDVPLGATITDVFDAARIVPANDANKAAASVISLWRFDPDTRKLRVTLNPPQSRAFGLIVRSQIAAGPLPFEQTAGLLSVNGAAGQLGSVGIATGSEVQLDSVSAEAFSSLNLEDFPAAVLQPLHVQIGGLTLRRAFRYTNPDGTIAMEASPVEADVRVETRETLSLGEDRTLLAVNASIVVTRAGIFRVSFVLPSGFDVESISGAALSHWTELKAPEG
ncbi:MAG TPA: hypothetical protein VFC26_01610, partial [Verrucomicrobiae bacterium]|nr:hypothetical protein [Verrucomicrobiae bacterium]